MKKMILAIILSVCSVAHAAPMICKLKNQNTSFNLFLVTNIKNDITGININGVQYKNNIQSKFYNDPDTLEKVWQFIAENEKGEFVDYEVNQTTLKSFGYLHLNTASYIPYTCENT